VCHVSFSVWLQPDEGGDSPHSDPQGKSQVQFPDSDQDHYASGTGKERWEGIRGREGGGDRREGKGEGIGVEIRCTNLCIQLEHSGWFRTPRWRTFIVLYEY
jgi:hypothetical protein